MKKKLSQKDFEKRIKIWTVIVPLITCVISSLTAVGVSYYSSMTKKERVVFSMSLEDLLETHRLDKQINSLIPQFYRSNDIVELNKIDAQLHELANREATIMRKYDPDYVPRWPAVDRDFSISGKSNLQESLNQFWIKIFLVIGICVLTIASYFFIRRMLRKQYYDQFGIGSST